MDLGVDDLLQRLSDITPKSLDWAWNGMIPLGKLTLLTGESGVGKSLVALQVAAMVSRGLNLPPGILPAVTTAETSGTTETVTVGEGASINTASRPRAVVVLSAEDAAEDTVLPRLTAAGADVSKVFVLQDQSAVGQAVSGNQDAQGVDAQEPEDRLFRLCRDLPRLESCLRRIQESGLEIGLIVIDPIDRYFGPSDKKQDRIEVVTQLVKLASRTGAAVLVISNFSWKAGNRSGTAVSQELTNAARPVLMVAQDLEVDEQRMVLPVKLNLSAMQPGAVFCIKDGVVQWDNRPISMTGDQYVTQARVKLKNPLVREEVYEIQRVEKWLKNELTPGRATSLWVRHRAAAYDISYGTLRRAFKNLNCWTSKNGKMWFWHLPAHQGQASEEERNTMVEYPNGDGVGVYRESVPFWLQHENDTEEGAKEGAQTDFPPELMN